MNVKENEYICKTCKYNYTKDCFVYEHHGYWLNDYATCDGWTAPDKVELTEGEKADVAGDIEAHRIMVEGGEISGSNS